MHRALTDREIDAPQGGRSVRVDLLQALELQQRDRPGAHADPAHHCAGHAPTFVRVMPGVR